MMELKRKPAELVEMGEIMWDVSCPSSCRREGNGGDALQTGAGHIFFQTLAFFYYYYLSAVRSLCYVFFVGVRVYVPVCVCVCGPIVQEINAISVSGYSMFSSVST